MKKLIVLVIAALLIAGGAVLYAGPGACTKCDCKAWVQKSKYHGSAGEPHAYCTCGHFWDDHQ